MEPAGHCVTTGLPDPPTTSDVDEFGLTPERWPRTRDLLQELIERRRSELITGLRAISPDSLPTGLATPDAIGPAAIDLRIAPRLGATARTIRAGQPITPDLGRENEFPPPVAERPTVEIDLGTVAFIFDFAHALAHFVDDAGRPIPFERAPEAVITSTVERMRWATDWFVSKFLSVSVQPLDQSSDTRRIWSSNLAVAAEWLVLGHEFGHALLHASGRSRDQEEAHAREYEADEFGIRLALAAAAATSNQGAAVAAYGGAQFYPGILELAEAYTDRAASGLTHPSAQDRIFRLSVLAPAYGASLEQLGFAITYIDGTLPPLANRVYALRPSAPDPHHPPHTYGQRIALEIGEILRRGVLGDLTRDQVIAAVTKRAAYAPSSVPTAILSIKNGVIRHKTTPIADYLTDLLPSLPEQIRAAVLESQVVASD